MSSFTFVKNELEHFPLGTVQHCQAIMNSCSYDSILALVCKESGQGKPDLHLFQCDDVKVSNGCAHTHTHTPVKSLQAGLLSVVGVMNESAAPL